MHAFGFRVRVLVVSSYYASHSRAMADAAPAPVVGGDHGLAAAPAAAGGHPDTQGAPAPQQQ